MVEELTGNCTVVPVAVCCKPKPTKYYSYEEEDSYGDEESDNYGDSYSDDQKDSYEDSAEEEEEEYEQRPKKSNKKKKSSKKSKKSYEYEDSSYDDDSYYGDTYAKAKSKKVDNAPFYPNVAESAGSKPDSPAKKAAVKKQYPWLGPSMT